MFNNLRLIEWQSLVGEGVTGAQLVTAQGVAKRNLPDHPYVVANEHVSGEIGRFLGLPLPPSYVLKLEDGEPIFISMNFNPGGDELPPIIPNVLTTVFPVESAGILVYDIFIGNSDRHSKNLAFDRKTKQVAVFDHSHALFGYIPGMGAARLQSLLEDVHLGISGLTEKNGHGGNRHCLLDVLDDPLPIGEWVDKIQQLPRYLLNRLSTDTSLLGVTGAEATALSTYLKERQKQLPILVKQHQAEFKKISQWGLI